MRQTDWKSLGLAPAQMLLPDRATDLTAWAVVACDQYTSQPEYWQAAEQLVGEKPSTLRITLPEIYLNETEKRLPGIYQAMADYLARGVLKETAPGFVLIRRITPSGDRLGLVAALDLEQYDYKSGSQGMIRATEGTIEARLPARVAVRRHALVECPHVMCLLNDEKAQVIEPVYAMREELPLLYDFELMQGGGHLTGWAVTDENLMGKIADALKELKAEVPFLYAVGDGNHSLATAKKCWEELKGSLTEQERETHPARYALAEIENLHSPAIQFEPIHRVVTGVNPEELIADYEETLGGPEGDNKLTIVTQAASRSYRFDDHPLKSLQAFLDEWLERHPEAEIDYIHGDDTLRRLADRPDAVGFMPCGFAKSELFPFIRKYGVLPRKTFSMGHAHEKRFYLEARRIEKNA